LEEFHSWLLSQPPSAIVGHSCDDGDCPLARFLNAQYEGSRFLVHCCDYERVMDDIAVGPDLPAERFMLPLWAQEYVWLVDLVSGNAELPIDRYWAYAHLRSVCSGCNLPLGGQVPTWKERCVYGC
jgi:hypothetical protein